MAQALRRTRSKVGREKVGRERERMDSDSQSTEPSRLGPYRVEDLLGRGGMGEVFRGFDERLHRAVALKRIRPGESPSPKTRARFRREARVMAGLNHSHIVQVYDLLETGEDDWLVMELVHGQCLAERMGEPLSVETVLSWARQIGSGLALAHKAGIVHRDLKAGNVMLTEEETVKLLDFGLAKHMKEGMDPESLTRGLSTAGQVLGTVSYMSPEQAQGHDLDGRSDLFSLGTLLYEMLTGESPFKGENPMETLVRICSLKQRSVRDVNPEVPTAVSELVDLLLEKSRNRRPASAEDVVERLDRLMQGDVSRSQEPSVLALETTRVTALSELEPRLDGLSSKADLEETLVSPPAPAQAVASSREPDEGPPRPADSQPPFRGARVLAVVVLLMVAWLAWWRGTEPAQVEEPVSIAVPVTEINIDSEQPQQHEVLAAGAVQQGLLGTLVEYPDLLVREPFRDAPSEPSHLAKAMAVDEVIVSRLQCRQGACQVLLRRVLGEDGRIVSSQRFAAPVEDPLGLSIMTGEHLQTMLEGLESRQSRPRPSIRPRDYARYLEIFAASRVGGTGFDPDEALTALEEITGTSKGFLDAILWEAALARQEFVENRDPDLLARALSSVEEAMQIDPEDPRVLRGAFSVYRDAGRIDDAAQVLEEAKRLAPGDANIWAFEAVLLEREGKQEEALEKMAMAVHREPSYIAFVELADMSYRAGDLGAARRHLESALSLVPGSYNCLSRLGQMELFFGRLERAAEVYEELVEIRPAESELTNLGVAYMLLRRLEEAQGAFERALDLAPSSPYAQLNLADVLFLRDELPAAQDAYEKVLNRVAEDPNPDDPSLQIAKAQALAQLGRSDAAVESIQGVTRSYPNEPQVLYGASLVFALLADEASAWWYAKQALDLGTDPRWFGFTWFDNIRSKIEARST